MLTWSTGVCPHCQGVIPWSTRLEWLDEGVRTMLVVAAVSTGALLGLMCWYMPKPDGATATTCVISIWYGQHISLGRLVQRLTTWGASPA